MLKAVVAQLSQEYEKLFGKEQITKDIYGNSENPEERRKRFLFELNHSGKYYFFKEKLKLCVVRIVKEVTSASLLHLSSV